MLGHMSYFHVYFESLFELKFLNIEWGIVVECSGAWLLNQRVSVQILLKGLIWDF